MILQRMRRLQQASAALARAGDHADIARRKPPPQIIFAAQPQPAVIDADHLAQPATEGLDGLGGQGDLGHQHDGRAAHAQGFLDHAQGLPGALQVAKRHCRQVPGARGRLVLPPDVSVDVAMRQEVARIQPGRSDHLEQAMAQGLQVRRQAEQIPVESADILHHAQGFRRPVSVGVQEAEDRRSFEIVHRTSARILYQPTGGVEPKPMALPGRGARL